MNGDMIDLHWFPADSSEPSVEFSWLDDNGLRHHELRVLKFRENEGSMTLPNWTEWRDVEVDAFQG